jgi:SAM-dependent methyltransferase
MSLSDIDFAERYRSRMAAAGRPDRGPERWDARAARSNGGIFGSPYVRGFVERMNLDGCATLLDVGCGAGAISLSVADKLERVYGLDFSPGMLEAFALNAEQRALSNATTIRLGWEDDWSDVPVCDIAVASRSTAVRDLERAVVKLSSKARLRACMTYPADGDFLPSGIRLALGRTEPTMPDYLYVVGILHHLGLHATLQYLPGENRLASCTTFEAVHEKVNEWIGPLTAEERRCLRRLYDDTDGQVVFDRMQWALFSWDTRA